MNNDYERYNFWHLEIEQINSQKIEDANCKKEEEKDFPEKNPELNFGN